MWLTLHFSWSVYFCVYIYAHPPYGPCPYPSWHAYMTDDTHMMRWWTHTSWHNPPDHTKCEQLQWLTRVQQLLWNQLPCFSMNETKDLWSQSVLQCRCTLSPYRPTLDTPQRSCDHKLPHPPIVMVTGSLAQVLRTNFVILDYCSHTGNGTGRGSHGKLGSYYY